MASFESLIIVLVYDDCGFDSWEGNGAEKKELQKQLILPYHQMMTNGLKISVSLHLSFLKLNLQKKSNRI